jgi:hypothetical protein
VSVISTDDYGVFIVSTSSIPSTNYPRVSRSCLPEYETMKRIALAIPTVYSQGRSRAIQKIGEEEELTSAPDSYTGT